MNFNLATEVEIMQTLAKRLKQYRLQKNMTQKELALASDVGSSTIQRFENGQSISLDFFIKIVMALGAVQELAPLFKPKISNIAELEQKTKIQQRQRVRR
ncbi:helix-turn-helix transcriptional regulator [Orbaceae bacterium ac157xtp]